LKAFAKTLNFEQRENLARDFGGCLNPPQGGRRFRPAQLDV
jgi:hypothetical protein